MLTQIARAQQVGKWIENGTGRWRRQGHCTIFANGRRAPLAEEWIRQPNFRGEPPHGSTRPYITRFELSSVIIRWEINQALTCLTFVLH